MSRRVFLVEPPRIAAIWPSVRPFIAECLAAGLEEFFGEWDIKKALIEGRWGLWVVEVDGKSTAAAVTLYEDYPKRRICLVLACAGRGAKSWVGALEAAISEHARQLGCSHLEARHRRGWLRFCEGKEVSRIMRKELV